MSIFKLTYLIASCSIYSLRKVFFFVWQTNSKKVVRRHKNLRFAMKLWNTNSDTGPKWYRIHKHTEWPHSIIGFFSYIFIIHFYIIIFHEQIFFLFLSIVIFSGIKTQTFFWQTVDKNMINIHVFIYYVFISIYQRICIIYVYLLRY